MSTSNQDLTGKAALITGAAGGIGKAIAQIYLKNGASVTLSDYQETPSDGLNILLSDYSEKARYIGCDVSNQQDVEALIAASIKHFRAIDILVNNAAVFDLAPILEASEESFDRLFDINVKAFFFMMQKVAKHMVKENLSGKIINMASQAGRRGEPLVSHYCATKAAVISYTQSAALALASHGINVNAISPGVINTPMWKEVDSLFAKYESLAIGEKKAAVGKAVPLGYMGYPEQVASLALFLASSGSDYITAQTYNIDGGNVMS
ncbi:L-iditol 2-dehydrogenase [Marinomonas transparens]|uniref:L-iditol 2-dehydrogenase n=1 Tax=Marinomonas transparens TaxID=2795388 RepID=A0A934JR99_9GAMM|nr:L-iditol 2-dehydrogenase [Marinomonas transparens]MBJ7536927.1 L-iditol 2-dehydrogenase [Marinomonas transparens]